MGHITTFCFALPDQKLYLFSFIVCAVIFFVFEDILLILVTFRALGRVSRFSLTAKTLCTAVSCLATIGRRILKCSTVIYLWM